MLATFGALEQLCYLVRWGQHINFTNVNMKRMFQLLDNQL